MITVNIKKGITNCPLSLLTRDKQVQLNCPFEGIRTERGHGHLSETATESPLRAGLYMVIESVYKWEKEKLDKKGQNE